MRLSILPVLVAALAVVALGAAESKDWKKAQTHNFVVYSNASDREMLATLRQLEAFRTVIGGLFPSLSLGSGAPVTVILFKDQAAFEPFGPRNNGKLVSNIAGYFTQSVRGDRFVLGAFHDSMTLDTAYHEYMHSIVHRNLKSVPEWVSEGVADFYSSFEMDEHKGTVIIGRIPPWRRTTLHWESMLPLKEVVTPEGATAILTRHRVDAPMFYAESWALVHFLAFSDKGNRAGQLPAYLAAINKGQSPEAAFTSAFGGSYTQIQSQLYNYLQRPLPAAQIDLKKLGVAGAVPVELASTRMQVADAEALQGCLLVENGADDAAAEKHLTAALADADGNADARECLAGVRLSQGKGAEALSLIEPLAAAAGASSSVYYTLGRAYTVANRREDALRAFSRATDARPAFVQAWLEESGAALALHRDAQADAALNEALRHSGDPDVLRARAYAAMQMNRPDVVVRDIRRYHERHGFADDSGFYGVFLGALAMRRLGQTADADALLAEAAAAVDPASWTARVLAFMQGKIDAKTFSDAAKDNGQRTEVHTYTGYADLLAGHVDTARDHFTWVRDHGSRNYYEYPLAVAELARLQAPQSGPQLGNMR